MAKEMTSQEFKPWNNAIEQRRLNEIGRQLASVSDRTDLIYYFQIIDDPEYNAFALPGGYVYVFRGLYEHMSEAQLTAVLAHEIAHITAKHGVKRLQSALGYQLLVGLALVGLGDKDPQVAEQLSGVSGTIYDLVSRGYSRQDELQADQLAVRYLRRAGVDPQALVRALEFLMNEKGPGGRTFEILSTHPRMEERIKKVKEEIGRVEDGPA
jgi:predicted Zn-dependent protease